MLHELKRQKQCLHNLKWVLICIFLNEDFFSYKQQHTTKKQKYFLTSFQINNIPLRIIHIYQTEQCHSSISLVLMEIITKGVLNTLVHNLEGLPTSIISQVICTETYTKYTPNNTSTSLFLCSFIFLSSWLFSCLLRSVLRFLTLVHSWFKSNTVACLFCKSYDGCLLVYLMVY